MTYKRPTTDLEKDNKSQKNLFCFKCAEFNPHIDKLNHHYRSKATYKISLAHIDSYDNLNTY